MANAPVKFDPSVYVHSPVDQGNGYLEHYQYLQANPGIPWDVACMDDKVLPARPGDLIIVCGRPGSGKTSFLARQAKRTAQRIAAAGKQREECVLYIGLEQHAEEMEIYFSADDEHTTSDYAWLRMDIKEVERKARARVHLPLWMIGYSRKHILQQTKALTMGMIWQAIDSMVYAWKDAPKPILLCIDYAQLLEPDVKHASLRLDVQDVIKQSKILALRIGCPLLLAAQAGRQVDGYDLQVPSMRDAQESAVIEQHCDKFFGISRPWKWAPHDRPLDVVGHNVPVTPELFLLSMTKQRLEEGNRLFALNFSMAELALAGLDLTSPEPVLPW